MLGVLAAVVISQGSLDAPLEASAAETRVRLIDEELASIGQGTPAGFIVGSIVGFTTAVAVVPAEIFFIAFAVRVSATGVSVIAPVVPFLLGGIALFAIGMATGVACLVLGARENLRRKVVRAPLEHERNELLRRFDRATPHASWDWSPLPMTTVARF